MSQFTSAHLSSGVMSLYKDADNRTFIILERLAESQLKKEATDFCRPIHDSKNSFYKRIF